MKCSRCSRPLKTAAVISGGLTIGPKCARLLGISLERIKRSRAPVLQDGQMALFVAEGVQS